jgi:heme/copper-type cytochrome/quinol oxidase subunit 2
MKRFIPILCFVLVIGLCAMTFACPACKDSVPSNDGQSSSSVPDGFNNSVYFMLCGFVTVLSMVVIFIVKSVRGANGSRNNGGPGFPIH